MTAPMLETREYAPAWAPRRVVCGVDGDAGGRTAAHQAGALAGDAPVELVAVTPAPDGRLFAPLPGAARTALAEARAALAGQAIVRVVSARSPIDGLLAGVSAQDLLAVGADGLHGPHGPILSALPAAALARGSASVLLARPGRGDVTSSLLVAIAGTAGDVDAARAAAAIAERHDCELALLAEPRHDAAYRAQLADAASAVEDTLGLTPLVVEEYGLAARAAAAACHSLDVSLVVVSRGPLAEPIARHAPCSVLVVSSGG
jgi:hypothetical protein